MTTLRACRRARELAALTLLSLPATVGCSARTEPLNESRLNDLAKRYAAAWSSQDPQRLASFYAERGELVVNGGAPAVGRAAVAEKARAFMTAFPDMVVKADSVTLEGSGATFHWTWTGTNSGPGGTGRAVRITGYEAWTLDAEGRIAKSDGHYDEAEYRRQVTGEGGAG